MKTKLLILFLTLGVGFGSSCKKESVEPKEEITERWIMVITGNNEITSGSDPVITIQQRLRDTTLREWKIKSSESKKITVNSKGPNASHIWFRSEKEWEKYSSYSNPLIIPVNESHTFEINPIK